MSIQIFKLVLLSIALGFILNYLIVKIANRKRVSFAANDLSRDHKRWTDIEVEVAAYVVLFQDSRLRLNDHYQVVLESLLSRSHRSVQGKMRRVSSVGSKKSDASELTEDVVYAMANLTKESATRLFLDNVRILGGNVELFKSYVYDK